MNLMCLHSALISGRSGSQKIEDSQGGLPLHSRMATSHSTKLTRQIPKTNLLSSRKSGTVKSGSANVCLWNHVSMVATAFCLIWNPKPRVFLPVSLNRKQLYWPSSSVKDIQRITHVCQTAPKRKRGSKCLSIHLILPIHFYQESNWSM